MRGKLRIVSMILAVALCGCRRSDSSAETEASARYYAAWAKQQTGDVAGYRAGLKELVDKYPRSRAALRARTALAETGQGGGMSPAAGVMAAIAIPAYMKYRARAASPSGASNGSVAGGPLMLFGGSGASVDGGAGRAPRRFDAVGGK
jgi:hypothetical protein